MAKNWEIQPPFWPSLLGSCSSLADVVSVSGLDQLSKFPSSIYAHMFQFHLQHGITFFFCVPLCPLKIGDSSLSPRQKTFSLLLCQGASDAWVGCHTHTHTHAHAHHMSFITSKVNCGNCGLIGKVISIMCTIDDITNYIVKQFYSVEASPRLVAISF